MTIASLRKQNIMSVKIIISRFDKILNIFLKEYENIRVIFY